MASECSHVVLLVQAGMAVEQIYYTPPFTGGRMNILFPLPPGVWESGSPLGVCDFRRSNLKMEEEKTIWLRKERKC